MNQILLILHFLGFGAGVASAVSNGVAVALSARSPESAPAYAKVGDVVSRFGDIGLVLLWLTGLIMIWSVYGGPGVLPPLFWLKVAAVVLLTLSLGMVHMRKAQARRGDASALRQLPIIGQTAAALLVVIVVLAVLAFS